MYNFYYKYKSVFYFALKLIIAGSAIYFISLKISTNKTFANAYFLDQLSNNVIGNYSTFFILVLFTITNWLIETLKWKTLVFTLKKIDFLEAGKQSLASLTASLLTPNRIGEYGAKAIYHAKFERSRIMILNFIGNFTQMMATCIFGIFAIVILWDKFNITLNSSISIWMVFIFILGLLFVITLKKYRAFIVAKIKPFFNPISIKTYAKTQSLALLKYLVFSHQFYYLLYIFGANINYPTAMLLIFTMYFITSVIPSFVIFDWLIKGSVAVALFKPYGVNEILILSITSLMWLLNFALPSLIGSYFILTFKSNNLILNNKRI